MNETLERGVFKKTRRIIAIGDLHGDILQLLSILEKSGLIEHRSKKKCIDKDDLVMDKWNWTGKDCHVVQMGDIFDGGGRKTKKEFEDNEVEILIFLIRLKIEAEKAGGNVLIIFGNHEYMNFEGNYSYVQKKTMRKCVLTGKSYIDLKYKHTKKSCKGGREKLFKIGKKGILANLMSKYCYGILQIGTTIFCHGGLKKEIGKKYTIGKMNTLLQNYLLEELNYKKQREFNEVYKDDGIIWFRGYVNDINKNCKDLSECLVEKGAERMVVGHTVQVGGISTKCTSNEQKNLFAIDVGLSRAFSSLNCQYLEIIDDTKASPVSCSIFNECNNKLNEY